MPWNLLRQAFVGSPHASRQDADECAKYVAMVMKVQYDSRHKPIFSKKNDFVYLKLQQRTDPGYILPTRDVTMKLTFATSVLWNKLGGQKMMLPHR